MIIPISQLFFQLFDHVGEAEVILRNTGKIGFNFNIIHPQREDEEAEGQIKVLEEQPDAWPFENEEGGEVRPGRPTVIPTTVSSFWGYFRLGGSVNSLK